jgi:hypothetical protein
MVEANLEQKRLAYFVIFPSGDTIDPPILTKMSRIHVIQASFFSGDMKFPFYERYDNVRNACPRTLSFHQPT